MITGGWHPGSPKYTRISRAFLWWKGVAAMDSLRKVFGHSAIYGLGSILTKLASFLLLPLYARALAPAEYGVWASLALLASGTSILLDLGMTNAIFRFAPEATDGQKKLVGATLALTVVFGVILVGAGLVGAQPLVRFVFGLSIPGLAGLFQVQLLSVFFRALMNLPLTYMRVNQEPVRSVAWSTCITLATLGLNVYFVAWLKMGIWGIVWAELVVVAVVTVLLVPRWAVRHLAAFDSRVARVLLGYGLPFVPTLIASWVLDLSDRLLLERLSTMDQVGLYAVGYKLGMITMLASTAFTAGWGPFMVQMSTSKDGRQGYATVFQLYLALATSVALATTLFAKPILVVMSSPAYYSAWRVVGLVSFSYVLNGLYAIGLTGVALSKRSAFQPVIVGAAAVTNVLLNLWLIPRWGIMATALTTLLAYCLMTVGTLWVSQRLYPIPYRFGQAILVLSGAGLLAGAADRWVSAVSVTGLLLRLGLLLGFAAVLVVSGTAPVTVLIGHPWKERVS